MFRSLLYPLIILLLASCSHPDAKTVVIPTKHKSYSVYNNTNSPLLINVYQSLDNYKYATGAIVSKKVAPGNTGKIDMNWPEPYYIDWITEDSVYTNWNEQGNDYDFRVMAHALTTGDRLVIAGDCDNGAARRNLIGNNAEVKLKAVNLLDHYEKSLWGTLAPTEQYLELSFSKIMEFKLKYILQADTVRKTGEYKAHTGGIEFGKDQPRAVDPYSLSIQPHIAHSYSADTFYLHDNSIDAYYVMVRY